MVQPCQNEVDAVAHFVQAARELRASPFFMEEYMSIGISMREGDPIEKVEGRFPDPNILQAVLVPFRRIWHQNEPCYHTRVANILKKYMGDCHALIDSFRFSNEKSVAKQMPWLRDVNLSPTDVVDLWLNTRYHHVGKSSRNGRFTRDDFERFRNQMGPVLFEYYFLLTVHEVGLSVFNIKQFAERFLRCCSALDLKPTFTLEPHPGETNIRRTTPGVSVSGDTPEQRVWRLRRRRLYGGFNEFLSLTNFQDATLAALLNSCCTFDDFLKGSSTVFEESDSITGENHKDYTQFAGCGDNHPTAVRNRKCRTGFMAKHHNGTFTWSGKCKAILDDQYLEFREAFLREPFK